MNDVKYQKHPKVTKGIKTLIDSAQTLTGTATTLGSVVDVQDYDTFTLIFKLTINDSINMRFKFGLRMTATGTDFYAPLYTEITDRIKIGPEYYEVNSDSNGTFIEKIDTGGMLFVNPQVWVETVGASAGTIDEAYYILNTTQL